MNVRITFFSLSLLLASSAFAEVAPAKVTTLAKTGVPLTMDDLWIVNGQEAMVKSSMGIEIQRAFEDESNKLRAVLEDLKQKIQRLAQDVEKQRAVMSPTALASKQRELERLQREYEDKANEAQAHMQAFMQEKGIEIGKEFELVIADLAKRMSKKLVIDASSGRVLYSAPEVEATDLVVAELDKKYVSGQQQIAKKDTKATTSVASTKANAVAPAA